MNISHRSQTVKRPKERRSKSVPKPRVAVPCGTKNRFDHLEDAADDDNDDDNNEDDDEDDDDEDDRFV